MTETDAARVPLRIERIVDPEDPRAADYRDLTDADLRRRRGLFVAEGRAIVLRLLAAARFPARSVLLTEAALEALRARLADRRDLAVYVASPEILGALVGYKFHRGCLAVGERGAQPPPAALIDPPGRRLLVALEHLADPENVGVTFRNALAFGADGVVLSGRCADPLYRKAIRASAGGALAIPFARLPDWRDGLERLRAAGYALVALTPRAGALDIAALGRERGLPERVALLLGAEDQGLSTETCAIADVLVRIPMAPGVDSLNVATAAGIALHRLASR